MTNLERIKSYSPLEMELFLLSLAYDGSNPWDKQFGEKFCKKCVPHKCRTAEGRDIEVFECEFADGKCPNGSEVSWWLNQEESGGD